MTYNAPHTSFYLFPKKERLRSKKHIANLFEHGSRLYEKSLIIYYLKHEETHGNQVLMVVSKKKFKRAVDRNLLKRRMREAYRLNKHLLIESSPSFFFLAFVYISDSILTFYEIQERMTSGLNRLQCVI